MPIVPLQKSHAIHSLFEWQAAVMDDQPCVISENGTLTFGELNDRANKIAHRLNSLGVTSGTMVGVSMESCPELIIALLAILKAGGAYVPLDPHFPDQRLEYMLRDTAAPVIILHDQTLERLQHMLARTTAISLNMNDPSAYRYPTTNPDRPISADDLACVMYTSGSTGQPKGVSVGHRSVVRLVHATDYCHFGPDEVFLHLAPLAFDASTFEIWGPLLNGGRLVLMPPGPPVPETIKSTIQRHGVTTLWLTAGLFHLMVDQCADALRPIRQLLAGGDVLSPRHVQKALAALENGILINGYGPTENTTFTCCFRMNRHYQITGPIPIGRPITNTSVYILDETLNQVPPGEPGELYTGGSGVAFGYLNNPDLTSARFLPNKFGSPGDRLYRTGDRVRCRPDGNLEFLGRIDDQVKVRGHRIEPSEIEANLLNHADVLQVAVLPYMLPTGDKQLVAYIVAAKPSKFSPTGLRRYLADWLPQPFIPAHFIRVDFLPLNANGKVDRTALPAPQLTSIATVPAADRSETETRLAALWSSILNCGVGLDDNFFELGGNSLLLIQLHARLSSILGYQLPVTILFEKTTIRALAGWLDGERPCAFSALKTQERADRQKRAFSQRGIRGIVR